jgi:hypothetical protein
VWLSKNFLPTQKNGVRPTLFYQSADFWCEHAAQISGSLCVFGDWFGRPMDNCHQLVSHEEKEGYVRLTFNEGETLEVWEPSPDGAAHGREEFHYPACVSRSLGVVLLQATSVTRKSILRGVCRKWRRHRSILECHMVFSRF